MSGKAHATDRRIQKTQKLLREALTSLIAEKDYDSIVVKEILDRANVGRSTFYAHYRDKDELLVSGIYDILGAVPSKNPEAATSTERVIWFSLPIFEHHDRHKHAGEARIGLRGRAVLHEHLRKVLAELIAGDARKNSRSGRKAQIPPDLLIHYIASTFILVLNWWIDSRSRLRPREVNELFRSLVLPILAGA
jgi:AcrR family transcriptional regulator